MSGKEDGINEEEVKKIKGEKLIKIVNKRFLELKAPVTHGPNKSPGHYRDLTLSIKARADIARMKTKKNRPKVEVVKPEDVPLQVGDFYKDVLV